MLTFQQAQQRLLLILLVACILPSLGTGFHHCTQRVSNTGQALQKVFQAWEEIGLCLREDYTCEKAGFNENVWNLPHRKCVLIILVVWISTDNLTQIVVFVHLLRYLIT